MFYFFVNYLVCATDECCYCLGTESDVGVKEVVTKNTRWWSWSNLIYPIPTGVGLTLLAVLQWRRLNKQQSENEQQPIYTRNLRVNILLFKILILRTV